MGKAKNKLFRVNMRLTQEEHDALNDITSFRGITVSSFLANAIIEEEKRVRKEREELARKQYLKSVGIDI